MRICLVSCALLAGCGSVTPQQIDAAPTPDTPASCGPTDQVDSCGATCAKCTVSSDREVAACDGTRCGFTCAGGAPACSDMTCSRLVYDFNDNTLEGLAARAPTNLAMAIRVHNGSPSLAIDVTLDQNQNIGEVSFTVPLCLTGNVDVSAKTVTAKIFFDDPQAPAGQQYYVQGSLPSPMANAFIGSDGIAANGTVTWSHMASMSQLSNASPTVTFQVGTFGAVFTGTVWFDDITIQ